MNCIKLSNDPTKNVYVLIEIDTANAFSLTYVFHDSTQQILTQTGNCEVLLELVSMSELKGKTETWSCFLKSLDSSGPKGNITIKWFYSTVDDGLPNHTIISNSKVIRNILLTCNQLNIIDSNMQVQTAYKATIGNNQLLDGVNYV